MMLPGPSRGTRKRQILQEMRDALDRAASEIQGASASRSAGQHGRLRTGPVTGMSPHANRWRAPAPGTSKK
jgi:hypothetical protein